MKKFIMPLIAVIFGVLTSSFTPKDCVDVYLVYDGSGSQDDLSNYDITFTNPGSKAGTIVLAWIRICVEGGTITEVIFDCVFEELDVVNDGSNSLNDEVEKIISVDCEFAVTAQLEKKNP